jgi:hypothetical protein
MVGWEENEIAEVVTIEVSRGNLWVLWLVAHALGVYLVICVHQ